VHATFAIHTYSYTPATYLLRSALFVPCLFTLLFFFTSMTPNLFLATQTLFSPHKWFRNQPKPTKPVRRTEHWSLPVPGTYEYIPGRGWYLIATDKKPEDSKAPQDAEVPTIKLHQPVQVKYSKVLKRYLLAPDYEMRKREGRVLNDTGRKEHAGFFQLDDGIAWVKAWDADGEFIPGPYKLWIPDPKTGLFRHMLKTDDPEYAERVISRRNSFEPRRGSQDSRSTQYNPSTGAKSNPSTRANSCRDKSSNPASRANTRPSSPNSGSSGNVPLSEATTLAAEVVAPERVRRESGLR
jgi:hypothetical protein